MAVTIETARQYLGIDITDDALINANITRALSAASATLAGAVGADASTYLANDPRLDELTLIYLDDLYSQRGLAAKVSGATRRLVASMEMQLVVELRAAREAAAASTAEGGEGA